MDSCYAWYHRGQRCTMQKLVERFVKDESGATAIEYGLIAAGIALVIIVAVNGIGSTLNTNFTSVNTQLR
jgi:pilus assembly protein Flp/PilA